MPRQPHTPLSALLFALLLVACAPLPGPTLSPASPTTNRTITLQPTTTSVSLTTPSPANPIRPTITPLRTRPPTRTPFPTLRYVSPERTWTPIPPPPLTARWPTVEEFRAYLDSFEENYYAFGLSRYIDIQYVDLSGDGELDLIAFQPRSIAVLVWDGSAYGPPFFRGASEWKYRPASNYTLEDWTNDGTPEVIYTTLDDAGGTSIFCRQWYTTTIHCTNDPATCQPVWSGVTGAYNTGQYLAPDQPFGPDITVRWAPVTLTTTPGDAVYLTHTSEAIALFTYGDCDNTSQFPAFDSRGINVYPSTTKTYQWDSTTFALIDEKVNNPATTVPRTLSLDATSSQGDIALLDDDCKLILNGTPLTTQVGCPDYGTLHWQDLTRDGREELIAVTVGFDGSDRRRLCAIQHLTALDVSTQPPREVANVQGCIMRSDYFGVRIDDINADGQSEILAAQIWPFAPSDCDVFSPTNPCWFELGYDVRVHTFDGTRFTYTGDMPEPYP